MILRTSFYSDILEMETAVSILVPKSSLPPRKNNSDSRPVVYLFHGMCGRSEDWLNYTLLPLYAERDHAIFVMPEVGRSFYCDMAHGQKFFTYVRDELPKLVGSLFQISKSREETAVMGASMGGYGALKCALSAPDRYGFCAAFSSACLFFDSELTALRQNGPTPEQRAQFGDQMFRDLQGIFGTDFRPGPLDDLSLLAPHVPILMRPRIDLACGLGDFYLPQNRRFRTLLNSLGYGITLEEREGNHDWVFFNAALERALCRWRAYRTTN